MFGEAVITFSEGGGHADVCQLGVDSCEHESHNSSSSGLFIDAASGHSIKYGKY